MNELEFKRHIKDLVHGHHHPEEHEWETAPAARKATPAKSTATKRRAPRTPSKRK